MRATIFAIAVLLMFAALRTSASDPAPTSRRPDDPLERKFHDAVAPFLQNYCVDCHGKGKGKPKGDLNLARYTTLDAVGKDLVRWEAIMEEIEAEAMPPAEARRHPEDDLRGEIVAWLREFRKRKAKERAGDPGSVPARRLSNAEYDHTIRDLTGVDIRPTQEFPVDPANEAGFDNSAESLTMSPALVKKYLEAARRVADHLVLKPDGIAFASHPVVADTDRDKYCVRRVIEFYKRQRTDYADYFLAAWRFRHRAELGHAGATLETIADEDGISRKYLATIWTVVGGPDPGIGPIAAVRALFDELPAPGGTSDTKIARAGCERIRDVVIGLRGQLVPEVKNLSAPGVQKGSQTMVLWKNRQLAANRMRYAGGAEKLKLGPLALSPGSKARKAMEVPDDPDVFAYYEATFDRFCATFPDAFVVTERARVYLNPEEEKKLTGRLLSAGFHSMTGYFRDDGPLYELVLDDQRRSELDRLWREFDFITGAPRRQYSSFLWFERAESRYMREPIFDFARAEDKDAGSEAKLKRLCDVYLAKTVGNGASETAVIAIKDYFAGISASIRAVEEDQERAEPIHVAAVQSFAERAFRRPLTGVERDGIAGFYSTLRQRDRLTHEDAVRDTLISVLMSPHFCYRVDTAAAGSSVRPLSDYALASRLSYFLWSSTPDEALLARAAAGELHRPEVLVAEARRMLQDDRVRGLATEFGANWLDVRRFEEHNSVDRERFKTFNDELRRAMFEEPVRFLIDVARNDRSILDLLNADHTFVNPALARHYGMPEPPGGPDTWVRVDGARRYGRGGLLPMAVFLTKNSPGLRTSPVKRGYWVVRRLLGEHIPAPPAQVPELPSDEAKLGELTLRQTLERHRAEKSCAGCHERFDPIGLAFEGYGPVGELRSLDLGGRPVDTRANFPGGREGEGLEGLRIYLDEKRQAEFVDNLCRKLLAYALGRSLLPSDDEAIATMRARLEQGGHRFGILVEEIIRSPQFLNRRVDDEQAEE